MAAQACAAAVAEELLEFNRIHDDVFSPKLWRVVPVLGTFFAIDFHRHIVCLKTQEESLEEIGRRVSAQCAQDDALALALSTYIEVLAFAMRELRALCCALDAKARGESFTWAEHKAAVRSYEDRRLQLVESGQVVNARLADAARKGNVAKP